MDITTVFGTVVGGSNPSGSTKRSFVHGGIRKPEHDGARRGRVFFQQKKTRDRIPPGALVIS